MCLSVKLESIWTIIHKVMKRKFFFGEVDFLWVIVSDFFKKNITSKIWKSTKKSTLPQIIKNIVVSVSHESFCKIRFNLDNYSQSYEALNFFGKVDFLWVILSDFFKKTKNFKNMKKYKKVDLAANHLKLYCKRSSCIFL